MIFVRGIFFRWTTFLNSPERNLFNGLPLIMTMLYSAEGMKTSPTRDWIAVTDHGSGSETKSMDPNLQQLCRNNTKPKNKHINARYNKKAAKV